MVSDIIKKLNEVDEAIRKEITPVTSLSEREALKEARDHVQKAITALLGR